MSLTRGALLLPAKIFSSRGWFKGRVPRCRLAVGQLVRGGGPLFRVEVLPLHLSIIFLEDLPLHPCAGLGVQGMGDVLEGTVLATLRGHRDEEARRTVNDLQVPHHEAVVEGYGDVRPEL